MIGYPAYYWVCHRFVPALLCQDFDYVWAEHLVSTATIEEWTRTGSMHLGEWTCMRVVVCSLQILCWICIFMFDRSPQEGFIFRQLYNLEMSNSCFMPVWLQHWTGHEPFSRMCLNVNVCGILMILLSNSMCFSENAASPGIHWACSISLLMIQILPWLV